MKNIFLFIKIENVHVSLFFVFAPVIFLRLKNTLKNTLVKLKTQNDFEKYPIYPACRVVRAAG